MPYHIDESGNPGLCTATLRPCPYGTAEQHYGSKDLARRAYEDLHMSEGLTPPLTRKQAAKLDQFFTKDELSLSCLETLSDKLGPLGYDEAQVHFVEPSAGGGSFVRAAQQIFPQASVKRGDIEPKSPDVTRLDFLSDDLAPLLEGDRVHRVVIGNPPFGHRAAFAQQFINRAFEISDTVAFVIPAQFQKYSGQKAIEAGARLVHDEALPYDSFTLNGTSYGVKCCFQVWTLRESSLADQRILEAPAQSHEDFNSWIVSSKASSKRHLQEAPWDYAVVTQGFKGQFELVPRSRAADLSMRRQYMLIQALTPEARKRIESLDFEALAAKNTTRIKGFGKADLVEAYVRSS